MSMKEESQSLEMDSTCQLESLSRVYQAKLVGYSLIKNFGTNAHVKLGTFDLAGHSWAINFYPTCTQTINYNSVHYIKFFIMLMSETSTPSNVACEFRLLDHSGKLSAPQNYNHTVKQKGDEFGAQYFMKKSEFESSGFLKDDCFMVQCTLRVIKPSYVDETKTQVVVPSSNLFRYFEKLLENKEGGDVTFEVDEEKFIAHKTVLAARSPVFKAQFFGSMVESESNIVKIEDVKPEVFKFMLHFIYTDMLPHEAEISSEMAQHLLVAADRYGLERLKLISGEILCRNLNVESSATTLVLADQHNCKELKEVCVDFVSSRAVLNDVMASEGFKHLMESCPFLLKELLEKVDLSRRF